MYIIIRPPDVVVDGLTFYHGFIFLLLLSFSPLNLRAPWTELDQNRPQPRKCDLKTHVQNLRYPLPLQIGAQNRLFGRLSNLTATLTAYIFVTKHDIDNRASALTTTRGLLRRLETIRTLVRKWLQIGPPFLPTLRKFCILFHCQASQTEISKRNSTTLCQTVDGKRR